MPTRGGRKMRSDREGEIRRRRRRRRKKKEKKRKRKKIVVRRRRKQQQTDAHTRNAILRFGHHE